MWVLLRTVVVVLALLRHQVASNQVWYGVQPPHNLYSYTPLMVFPGDTPVRCASGASTIITPQVCNLFHIQEGHCHLYDLPVNSEGHLKLTPTNYSITTYTIYNNVCIVDGVVYEEGQMKTEGCFTTQICQPPVFIDIDLPSSRTPPFESHLGGCYYLYEVEQTFYEGRQYCSSLGGDLAYSPNFTTIQSYLKEKTTEETWVGVEARKWVDGRNVVGPDNEGEWASADPDGKIQDCARMRIDRNDLHYLADRSCSTSYFVLCQITV